MGVVLERMRWWHIPAIVELERQLFTTDSPWTALMFWGELADGHHYVVHRVQGEVCAYAGLSVIGGDADVRTIGVAEHLQGNGIGQALLTDLLTAAGFRRVLLEVRTDNAAALKLYERNGFHVIGVRRRYYQPSGADAYTMERPARRAEPTREERP